MKNPFIDPKTDDIRKEVMYVAYGIATLAIILALVVCAEALIHPENITYSLSN